jgi:hypothetical protein
MKTQFIILTVAVLLIVGVPGCGDSDGLSGRPGMLYFYADT